MDDGEWLDLNPHGQILPPQSAAAGNNGGGAAAKGTATGSGHVKNKRGGSAGSRAAVPGSPTTIHKAV